MIWMKSEPSQFRVQGDDVAFVIGRFEFPRRQVRDEYVLCRDEFALLTVLGNNEHTLADPVERCADSDEFVNVIVFQPLVGLKLSTQQSSGQGHGKVHHLGDRFR